MESSDVCVAVTFFFPWGTSNLISLCHWNKYDKWPWFSLMSCYVSSNQDLGCVLWKEMNQGIIIREPSKGGRFWGFFVICLKRGFLVFICWQTTIRDNNSLQISPFSKYIYFFYFTGNSKQAKNGAHWWDPSEGSRVSTSWTSWYYHRYSNFPDHSRVYSNCIKGWDC